MSSIQTFKDLIVWQTWHQVVLQMYILTKTFPNDELFGLVSQMRRAAVSVTSNIAEGFSRSSSKEKVRFYSIASGSAIELQNQLLISLDVGYIVQKNILKLKKNYLRSSKCFMDFQNPQPTENPKFFVLNTNF